LKGSGKKVYNFWTFKERNTHLTSSPEDESRASWYMRALWASLAVNFLLVLFCALEWYEAGYFLLTRANYPPKTTQALAAQNVPLTLRDSLMSMREKSDSSLELLLDDRTIVDQGYQVRDLALGTLVSSRYFNLQKALVGNLLPKQERKVEIEKGVVTLFPGISDSHFQAIRIFIQTESYPYTLEGLFMKLTESQQNEGMKIAFTMSPEFLAAFRLFGNDAKVSQDELTELLLSGSFAELEQFVADQKKSADVSPEARQRFLMNYASHGSPQAAALLVKLERSFAETKVSDSQAMMLLGALETRPALCQEYALSLLESPRSDAVWKYATSMLAKVAPKDGALLAKMPRRDLLVHFGRKAPPLEKSKVVATKTPPAPATAKKGKAAPATATVKPAPKVSTTRTYVVEPGDSLWRISKKFGVDVKQIILANQLESESLKPGSVLRIPS
jgi:hypothetical protein